MSLFLKDNYCDDKLIDLNMKKRFNVYYLSNIGMNFL